jgi:hypothetical protein
MPRNKKKNNLIFSTNFGKKCHNDQIKDFMDGPEVSEEKATYEIINLNNSLQSDYFLNLEKNEEKYMDWQENIDWEAEKILAAEEKKEEAEEEYIEWLDLQDQEYYHEEYYHEGIFYNPVQNINVHELES